MIKNSRLKQIGAWFFSLTCVAVATTTPPNPPNCKFYPKCVPDKGSTCEVAQGCVDSNLGFLKCEQVDYPGCKEVSDDPNSTCPTATLQKCSTLATLYYDNICSDPKGDTALCPGNPPQNFCKPVK